MNTGEATVEQATRNVRPHVIKWEGTLKESIKKNIAANYDERRLRQVHYRPFTKMWIYYDPLFINSVYRIPVMFPDRSDGANQAIVVAGRGSTREFSTVATNTAPDLELVSKGQAMPRYEHASPNLALSLSLSLGESNDLHHRAGSVRRVLDTGHRQPTGPASAVRRTSLSPIHPPDRANQVISMTGPGWKGPFSTLISDIPPDIQFMGNGQAFPRYTYPKETSR